MSYSFSIFKSSNDYKSYSISELQSEIKSNGVSKIKCDPNNLVISYLDNIGFFRYQFQFLHKDQTLRQVDFYTQDEHEICASFIIKKMKIVDEKIECKSRRFEFEKEIYKLANEYCKRQLN